jgi:hypothetical protein
MKILLQQCEVILKERCLRKQKLLKRPYGWKVFVCTQHFRLIQKLTFVSVDVEIEQEFKNDMDNDKTLFTATSSNSSREIRTVSVL